MGLRGRHSTQPGAIGTNCPLSPTPSEDAGHDLSHPRSDVRYTLPSSYRAYLWEAEYIANPVLLI